MTTRKNGNDDKDDDNDDNEDNDNNKNDNDNDEDDNNKDKEVWRQEKARHVTNNDDDYKLIPPTMTTTMTMTTMTTSYQSLPFLLVYLSLVRVVVAVMTAAEGTPALVAALMGSGGSVSGSDGVRDGGGGGI
jgi:hypothetical protein